MEIDKADVKEVEMSTIGDFPPLSEFIVRLY